MIGDRVINRPSYVVKIDEEDSIRLTPESIFNNFIRTRNKIRFGKSWNRNIEVPTEPVVEAKEEPVVEAKPEEKPTE